MTMQAENQPQAARQSAVREMSDEELRAQVAKLCGWRKCKNRNDILRSHLWTNQLDGEPTYTGHPPNYPADLNAMHEAEKILTYGQWPDYNDTLCDIASQNDDQPWVGYGLTHSTARQRAEAFVLTLAPSLPAAVQPPNEV